MRRKRFQRGSLKPRKRNGRNYWYAQWREEGKPKSKEIGLCAKMSRVEAEAKLGEILQPVNAGADKAGANWTFARFCEGVYLPVCFRRWKTSTGMTEANRIQVHLIAELGLKQMEEITREELQALLDLKALTCGRSVVDHLRFRLRSIFALAISEGVVDRKRGSHAVHAAKLPGRTCTACPDAGTGSHHDRSAESPGTGDRAFGYLGGDEAGRDSGASIRRPGPGFGLGASAALPGQPGRAKDEAILSPSCTDSRDSCASGVVVFAASHRWAGRLAVCVGKRAADCPG